MAKFTGAAVLFLLSFTLIVTEKASNETLPPYITEKEFEFARKHPLTANNNNGPLPLPPFGESSVAHPSPRPGFGPRLWTNATVPYTLDPTFSAEQREYVAIALNTYHEATCIRFIPKTAQHTSWVEILYDAEVCGVAHVCMNTGAQFAKFGGSCVNPGTMVHELGHTLCMGHEQTRLDRDRWIAFNINVCQPHGIDGGDFRGGLHKLYDFVSIEHYEGECYNGCIVPKVDGVTKCGSGGPLSVLDIEILNEMYGCNSGCMGYRYVNKRGQLTNPIEAGAEFNGDVLYACRAYFQGDIIPGKYHMSQGQCHVAWNGTEASSFEDVEILTNPHGANLRWESSSSLPPNAIRGGRTNERETLYVVRCRLQGPDNQESWHPGKWQQGVGASISYGGFELSCAEGSFEFLVCA